METKDTVIKAMETKVMAIKGMETKVMEIIVGTEIKVMEDTLLLLTKDTEDILPLTKVTATKATADIPLLPLKTKAAT